MVELAGAGNMSANYANEIIEFGTKLAKVSTLLYQIILCVLIFLKYIFILKATYSRKVMQ